MKKSIHPESRTVVFKDMVTGEMFLINSTVKTKETTLWTDGKTYPLVKLEISSSSHPFYTGQRERESVGTRAETFEKKYAHNKGVRNV
jgi:large subunit ribosomal protein L31